ncbi:hypothetical protein ACIP79_02895 [Streptomyces sp. NPDC088747]|uniref:hypothetical protein n=1 Tax=Streptomyces sp. NPDC088747 TaxID=3365886 RepID=UPI00381DC5FB
MADGMECDGPQSRRRVAHAKGRQATKAMIFIGPWDMLPVMLAPGISLLEKTLRTVAVYLAPAAFCCA